MTPAHITFFVGLARQQREIAIKGYARQRITLVHRPASDDYANPMPVDFGRALMPWGMIDGVVLSGGLAGDIIATTPLAIPIFVHAGHSFVFAADMILMNRKSLNALCNAMPQRLVG